MTPGYAYRGSDVAAGVTREAQIERNALCTTPRCKQKIHARGMCRRHYNQWWHSERGDYDRRCQHRGGRCQARYEGTPRGRVLKLCPDHLAQQDERQGEILLRHAFARAGYTTDDKLQADRLNAARDLILVWKRAGYTAEDWGAADLANHSLLLHSMDPRPWVPVSARRWRRETVA